jgi:hypothetical protein
MRYLIALGLVVLTAGCAPTTVTRRVVTTTHADGSKETVDTKEIVQHLDEMKPQAIGDVLDMP